MKWVLPLLILLLPLKLAAAEKPTIELLFGIEEEMRPRAGSLIFKYAPVVAPALFGALHPNIGIPLMASVGIIGLSGVGGGGFNFWLSLEKAVRHSPEKVFELCNQSGKYLCTREKNKIFFHSRETNEVLGWVNALSDPFVVEITTNPFRLKELDLDMGEIMRQGVFGLKKAGLRKATLMAGGHVHIDFNSLFRPDPKGAINYQFFRNYVVDWANHDELYYGALHYDPKPQGAEPLLNNFKKRELFKSWLDGYDEMLASGGMTEGVFNSFRYRLQKHCGFAKGDAFNVGLDKTIELRALRNRSSVEELKRVLEIIQGRAQYIHAKEALIPYYDGHAIQSAQDAVDRFAFYIKEAGLDWKTYKKVMPKPWQLLKPREYSEEVLFRTGNIRPSSCFRTITWFMIHGLGI